MPLASRVERMEAEVQVLVAVRLSARWSAKPLVLGQESSTRLVPGTGRIAISGRDSTVKLLHVGKLPCGVSIVIGPVVALGGTIVVICRSVNAAFVPWVKSAGTPFNRTRVAPVKLVPFSVRLWPG